MDEVGPVTEPGKDASAKPRQNGWQWLAWGLLGLVLLAGLVVAGLNTVPGRALLARQLSGWTFANGLRLEVGRIEGSLY